MSPSHDQRVDHRDYETIRVERRGRVGWIRLHRPEALNALNTALMHEVVAAAEGFDADDGIGAIVVTGSERAFAAGADIKEMERKSAAEMRETRHFGDWSRFAAVSTPTIAAVSGYALGGGCELAMMCDIIIASETARFGQPEIALGVIPGMGGTQRLLRAVGAYKAADIVLTGRQLGAEEAERAGLVSRVVPSEGFEQAVAEVAATIASKSLIALKAATAALDAAQQTSLAEGLAAERERFTALFDSYDQKEGMAAFRERRTAVFEGR